MQVFVNKYSKALFNIRVKPVINKKNNDINNANLILEE